MSTLDFGDNFYPNMYAFWFGDCFNFISGLIKKSIQNLYWFNTQFCSRASNPQVVAKTWHLSLFTSEAGLDEYGALLKMKSFSCLLLIEK